MLRVENLTKKFKKVTAVDNVSFEVNPGEIIGLLGENGAGKTTTLRMLATMLKPTSGNAMIDGYNIIDNPNKIRERITILNTIVAINTPLVKLYIVSNDCCNAGKF